MHAYTNLKCFSFSVANMFGVVIIFLFFFMYFDDFRKEVLGEVKLSQLWMYLHFPLHLCQVAFGIALTDTISLYESQSAEAASTASEGTSAVSHLAAALKMAAETTVAAAAEEGSSTESHVDPSYVFKSFWVAGGLIICLNALIKIVNTPIAGGKALLTSSGWSIIDSSNVYCSKMVSNHLLCTYHQWYHLFRINCCTSRELERSRHVGNYGSLFDPPM